MGRQRHVEASREWQQQYGNTRRSRDGYGAGEPHRGSTQVAGQRASARAEPEYRAAPLDLQQKLRQVSRYSSESYAIPCKPTHLWPPDEPPLAPRNAFALRSRCSPFYTSLDPRLAPPLITRPSCLLDKRRLSHLGWAPRLASERASLIESLLELVSRRRQQQHSPALATGLQPTARTQEDTLGVSQMVHLRLAIAGQRAKLCQPRTRRGATTASSLLGVQAVGVAPTGTAECRRER